MWRNRHNNARNSAPAQSGKSSCSRRLGGTRRRSRREQQIVALSRSLIQMCCISHMQERYMHNRYIAIWDVTDCAHVKESGQ